MADTPTPGALNVGTLTAVLTADVSEFVAGLQGSQAQLDLFGASAEGAAGAAASLGAPLTEAGAALAGVERAAAGAATGLQGVGGAGAAGAEGLAGATAATAAASAELTGLATVAPTVDAQIAEITADLAALQTAQASGSATQAEYVAGLELLRARIGDLAAGSELGTAQVMRLAAAQSAITAEIGPATTAAMVNVAADEAAAKATDNWTTTLGRVVTAEGAETAATLENTAAVTANAAATEGATLAATRGERAVSRFGMGAAMMASGTRAGVFEVRSMAYALFQLVPAAGSIILTLSLVGAAWMAFADRASKASKEAKKELDELAKSLHRLAVEPPALPVVDRLAALQTMATRERDTLSTAAAEYARYEHAAQTALGGTGALIVFAFASTKPIDDYSKALDHADVVLDQLSKDEAALSDQMAFGTRDAIDKQALALAKLTMTEHQALEYEAALLVSQHKLAAGAAETWVRNQERIAAQTKVNEQTKATTSYLQEQTRALTDQIAKTTMSATEWARYQAAERGVGAEGQALLGTLRAQALALEAQQRAIAGGVAVAAGAMREVQGPLGEYVRNLELLRVALAGGKISQDAFNQAVGVGLMKLEGADRATARQLTGYEAARAGQPFAPARLDLGLGTGIGTTLSEILTPGQRGGAVTMPGAGALFNRKPLDDFKVALDALQAPLKQFKGTALDAFGAFVTATAQAFGAGQANLRGFGAALLSMTGQIVVSVGEQLIAAGAAELLIPGLFGNAAAAIAEGAALVAAGTALSASAGQGGGGGSFSGGMGAGWAGSYNPSVGRAFGAAYAGFGGAPGSQGDVYITFPSGKVFDPSNPNQVDDFRRMMDAIQGRHIIIGRRA